jgi:protein SCO1
MSSSCSTIVAIHAVRRLPIVCALCCAALNGRSICGQQPREQTPNQIVDGIGIEPKLGTKLPLDLEFVDADGRTVRLGELLGDRPVILHLVYYECPMLCKLSSDGLLRSLGTLSLDPGKDFSIVTVSFNPREGPELSARARELATRRLGSDKVDGAWHFLTGQAQATHALCDSVGFRYVFDEKTGQYGHASGVFVLTPDGTLSRFLTGIEYSPRDLRLALVEASAGKVGSAVDQVLLMCYMYDPTKGKYGLAIMTAIRLAGLMTVAALGTSIFVMLRRERRQRTAADAAHGEDLYQGSTS